MMCDSSWSDVRSKRARGARHASTCCIVVTGRCWQCFREPDVFSWMVSYARLLRFKSIIVKQSQSMKRKRYGCTDTFNMWRDVKWGLLSSASCSFIDFILFLMKLRLIFRECQSSRHQRSSASSLLRSCSASATSRSDKFQKLCRETHKHRSKQLCITDCCAHYPASLSCLWLFVQQFACFDIHVSGLINLDQLSMFGSCKALTRKRMEAGKEMKVGGDVFFFPLVFQCHPTNHQSLPQFFWGEWYKIILLQYKLHRHQIIIVIRNPPSECIEHVMYRRGGVDLDVLLMSRWTMLLVSCLLLIVVVVVVVVIVTSSSSLSLWMSSS